MSVIFTETFEGLSLAALVGQNSWAANSGGSAGPPGYNSFVVQNSVVRDGSQAMSVPNNVNGSGCPVHTFTGVSTGTPTISFYGRASTTGSFGLYMGFGDSSQRGWYVRFNNDATLTLFNTNFDASTSLGSYSADTWYFFEAEVDVSNKRCRVRVNGGTYSSYVTASNFDGTFGMVFPNQGSNQSGTSYLDTIVVDNGVAPSGPTNLKSFDGNVKANIKSLDGNTLANIKSLDGNS